MSDGFDDPMNVSAYPKVKDLVGHLVLFTPTKLDENLLNANFSKPGKPVYEDRVTTDVVVLDGPVGDLDGTEFPDMWVSNGRLVNQLKRSVGKRVLARVSLKDTSRPAGEGNPYGLEPGSDEDKALAKKYLAELKKRQDEEDPFAI
jgi:hypothetical protein